jgi:hypothetical protein
LSTAQAWVATATYTAERDHLLAHPELLDLAADTAVDDALLAVDEDEAARYQRLRAATRTHGAETAYRPLLLGILAHQFAAAPPATQRELLASRRADLLTDIVEEALTAMEGEDPIPAQRARALLALTASGDHEAVFDALGDHARFPDLLRGLVDRTEGGALTAAATIAITSAQTAALAADAAFYLAVGAVFSGDQERAMGLLAQARNWDPAQASDWITMLAEIGVRHPAVLALIPSLTSPPEDSAPPNQTTAPETEGEVPA